MEECLALVKSVKGTEDCKVQGNIVDLGKSAQRVFYHCIIFIRKLLIKAVCVCVPRTRFILKKTFLNRTAQHGLLLKTGSFVRLIKISLGF